MKEMLIKYALKTMGFVSKERYSAVVGLSEDQSLQINELLAKNDLLFIEKANLEQMNKRLLKDNYVLRARKISVKYAILSLLFSLGFICGYLL